MAVVSMNIRMNDGYDELGYTKSVDVTAGATSDDIRIPPVPAGGRITVTVIPTGTAKAQYSTSTDELITAGTATWIDWAEGSVTANTSDAIVGPVTGVRLVSVADVATMEVVV